MNEQGQEQKLKLSQGCAELQVGSSALSEAPELIHDAQKEQGI